GDCGHCFRIFVRISGYLVEQAGCLDVSHCEPDENFPSVGKYIIANRAHRSLRIGDYLITGPNHPTEILLLGQVNEMICDGSDVNLLLPELLYNIRHGY